jgi:hypothetical protein
MKALFAKSCGFISIICVLSALPAFGGVRNGWVTLPSEWGQPANRYAEEAEARKQQTWQQAQNAKVARENQRNDILRILEQVGPDAYRKYSDGTVAYLGLLLFRHEGFITNTGPQYTYLDKMAVIDTGYKVEDVDDEGCRISALKGSAYQDRDSDIFVVGQQGYSGRTYSDVLMLRIVGDYTYKTVSGASRKIPKFELGQRATKAEYTEFFWRKGR